MEKISIASKFRDMVGSHSIVDKVLSMYLLFLLLSERKYIFTKNVGVSTLQAYSVFIHRDALRVQNCTDMSAASGCFSNCEKMFLTLQRHIWFSGASSGFDQTKLSAEESPEQ